MNPHTDLDPTAGRVISHDAGRRLDSGLEWLTEFELSMLYEAASGLTVPTISRKHRVPQAIINYIVSTVALRQSLTSVGITSGDASDLYSQLVQRVERLAAPRCRFCQQVLRKALEPRGRGRPASYCGAECRTAAAKTPATPKWQTGYLGTCDNYLHGCRCLRKDEIAFDDSSVILTPSRDILLLGTMVGRLSHPTVAGADTILIEASMVDNSPGPVTTARYTAIRILAGRLWRKSGLRKVAVLAPDRLERLRAKGYDFRSATRIDGKSALVWNLERYPPPPTHIVA